MRQADGEAGYHGKNFNRRLGRVTVRCLRVQCCNCGEGHYPLDRHLGTEKGNLTPGAARVIADIARDENHDKSLQKLRNTARTCLGSGTIHRWLKGIYRAPERFEREEVVPGEPASESCYLPTAGTGGPDTRGRTPALTLIDSAAAR